MGQASLGTKLNEVVNRGMTCEFCVLTSSTMLKLKPNCERCEKALPPMSSEAFICSFECTFCEACVNSDLNFVCPNCGGVLEKRPTRAAVDINP